MNRINQITKFHNTLQYLHLLPKDEQINEKSFINHSKHIKNNEIN